MSLKEYGKKVLIVSLFEVIGTPKPVIVHLYKAAVLFIALNKICCPLVSFDFIENSKFAEQLPKLSELE